MIPKMRLLTICLLWSSCKGTSTTSGLRGQRPPPKDGDRQLDLIGGTTTNTGGASFAYTTVTTTSTTPAPITVNPADNFSNNNNNENNLDCSSELSFDITCQGDCNFADSKGTCESKMFQYHGGPCSQLSSISSMSSLMAIASRTNHGASNSDTAANCQDFHDGPPTLPNEDVFVVISDANDPSKKSQMWTRVGGFFWTDYRDYDINDAGLSSTQNITFYKSPKTTYDNMLQTMLFYAPCELGGTPLENLDRDHASVQLFATAIDPVVRAHLNLEVRSQTQQKWLLQSASVTTNIDGGELSQNTKKQSRVVLRAGDLINSGPFASVVPSHVDNLMGITVPIVVEMNHDDTLSVVGDVRVISTTPPSSSGMECRIKATYTSENRNGGGPGPAGSGSGSSSGGPAGSSSDREIDTSNTPPIPIASTPSSSSSSSSSSTSSFQSSKWWP